MFEFLKKKISDFTEKITGTVKKPADGSSPEKANSEVKMQPEIAQADKDKIEAPEEAAAGNAVGEKFFAEEALYDEAMQEKEILHEPLGTPAGAKPDNENKLPGMKGQEKRALKAKAGITEAVKGLVLGKARVREEDG